MLVLRTVIFHIVALLATSRALYCALIPPSYFDGVVAIGFKPITVSVDLKNPQKPPVVTRGQFSPRASGFIYGLFEKKIDESHNQYRTYLVTNSHVLDGLLQAEDAQIQLMKHQYQIDIPAVMFLRFNTRDAKPARDDIELPLNDPQHMWGRSTKADVAAIGISTDFLDKSGVEYSYFHSDDALDRTKAKDIGVGEGDGVFALGFPMGMGVMLGPASPMLFEDRNYVIARQGSIARIRDCLAGVTNEFLADLFIFPGNSGGPVVLRPEMLSIQGTKPNNIAYLIGIVREYIPYSDIAVSQQTQQPRIIFQENSGLAGIIPIDYVNELLASLKQ
jgi:hypothetical protein